MIDLSVYARKAAEALVGSKENFECPDPYCDSAGLACGSCWETRVEYRTKTIEPFIREAAKEHLKDFLEFALSSWKETHNGIDKGA